MIHFPLTLLIRYYISNDAKRGSIRDGLKTYGVGVVACLAIASIWMGLLTIKYGEFTVTKKGKIAYALMGPEEIRHPPHFKSGLHRIPNMYSIHVFEDPSELTYTEWSPFENKRYFLHQVDLIKRNLVYMLNHFVNLSPFFTYAFVIGILSIVPVALMLNRLNEQKKFLYAWTVMTFIVYSSGYILLIARSPRRFYALMVIFLFAAGHFMVELINGMREIIAGKRAKLLSRYLLIIIVLAFSLKPGIHLLKSFNNIVFHKQVNAYKDIADQILTVDFPAPYAIVRSAQKEYTDFYIAYYLEKQFLGRPLSANVEGITMELVQVDAASLLVFDNAEIVQVLKNDRRYAHVGRVKLREDSRYENAVNVKRDLVKKWDREVNVFLINQ
jgi:hypothetical protein